MSREVVVVSGVRTAIGTYGGSLKDIPPTQLAATVVRESLARAGVDGQDVGHVVFGHVVNTEPKDMYLSRVAAINGGCAEGTPAYNVNRLCGSGLQAIVAIERNMPLARMDADVQRGRRLVVFVRLECQHTHGIFLGANAKLVAGDFARGTVHDRLELKQFGR